MAAGDDADRASEAAHALLELCGLGSALHQWILQSVFGN
jgi:hypothetical protein